MGIVAGLARTLLFLANFVFFVVGIAMIVVGALAVPYIKLNTNSAGTEEAIPAGAIFMVVAVGTLVTIMAFLGCCGAWKNGEGKWRFALYLYALLLLVVICVQLAAAAMLMSYAGELKDYPRSQAQMSEWQRKFENSLNATYNECCTNGTKSDKCDSVRKLELDGKGVCEYKPFDVFLDKVIDTTRPALGNAGYSLLAIGVLEVLFFFIACFVGCRASRRKNAEAA